MKIWDVFKYSASTVKRQKLRTFLTVLGILIGITAIVSLLSLSGGFQATISDQLTEGLNTKTIIVSTRGSAFQQDDGDGDFTLYLNDTDTLEDIDHVESVVPLIVKTVQVEIGNETTPLTVSGVDYQDYASVYDEFEAERGTIPKEYENNVSVVGNSLYNPWDNGTYLYDVGDNLTLIWNYREGTTFIENRINTTVKAVLPEIGSFSIGGGPTDTGIYLPLEQFTEIFDTEEVNSFIVILDDDSQETINQVSEDIEDAFFDKVSVTSAKESIETIESAFGTIEVFLGAIAGISLIVAGIGIMNIMIVSVMERTREIGIIKSLGMKNRTILAIFLAESLLIGLIGSIGGIFTGWLLSNLFGRIIGGGGFAPPGAGGGGGIGGGGFNIVPVLGIDLVLQALFFGVLVSVIFGLYPAWRASRLPPVEALRYE
jgi:putative ABC transport system permease protein